MAGKQKFLVVAGVMMLNSVTGFAAFADAGSRLDGNWARDDGTTRIAIAPCGTDLCAVNIWVKDPNGKEKVGDRLVLTLQPVSSSELQGPAFDERRQMHYKMTITLTGNDEMRTSGCVFLGIVCKSAGWTRMN